MIKVIAVVLSIAGAGCGAECLPSALTSAASYPVRGAPAQSFAIAHSADELRAALASVQVAPPQQPLGVAHMSPEELARTQKEQLDAFISGTSFATDDVALVRAGGERARLAGAKTEKQSVTLYFAGQCSACAGGDPGSYYEAAAADDAARAERIELVRVPKAARVDVRVCPASCGRCPTNVP